MNTPAIVEVQLDTGYIQEELQRSIAEFVKPQLQMVDKPTLEKMYNMSPNELEPLLRDPRVKILERRKGERGKRRWFYSEVVAALREVIDEQY